MRESGYKTAEGRSLNSLRGDLLLAGTVHGIEEPFFFESRRLVHAGHCGALHHSEGRRRVIMVAFCTLHASTMEPVPREGLLELGFALPTTEEIQKVMFASSVGEDEKI